MAYQKAEGTLHEAHKGIVPSVGSTLADWWAHLTVKIYESGFSKGGKKATKEMYGL